MNYFIAEVKHDNDENPARFTIQNEKGESVFAGSILECEGWVRLRERDMKINVTFK